MLTIAENVRTRNENLGLFDRVARLLIGSALIGTGLVYLTVTPDLVTTNRIEHWLLLGIALGIYPLMTGILGMDPVYHHFGLSSGSRRGRNQCGSFPYQVKALFGRAPKYCEVNDEHSLEACHDDPKERPRHALWRIDQEPMLYPDDEAWEEFSRRERARMHRA